MTNKRYIMEDIDKYVIQAASIEAAFFDKIMSKNEALKALKVLESLARKYWERAEVTSSSREYCQNCYTDWQYIADARKEIFRFPIK